MLAEIDYDRFRELVETQSLRSLKRYLDYGKRVRKGSGLPELDQWVGRILFDRDGVYSIQDRASAFQIGAYEWLARHWGEVSQPTDDVVAVSGTLDKVRLLRWLIGQPTPGTRSAAALLFARRYGRIWRWVEERAAQLDEDEPPANRTHAGEGVDDEANVGDDDPLFERFLDALGTIDPLPSGGDSRELERVREEAQKGEERMRRELGAATDRAERAVTRLESLEEEVTQLRRSAKEGRDSEEKLREERSRRIKVERQSRDAVQELKRLKVEYVKLDERLRETAAGRAGQGSSVGFELGQLAELEPRKILGLSGGAVSERDLAQARRRLAAVFHSDRAAQLPAWVGALFDRLLGIVNDACDRAGK